MPPGGVNVGQDPANPERIRLAWDPLSCLQLNSRFVQYVIILGRRDGMGSNRTVTTTSTIITSSSPFQNTGLGFVVPSVEYFFRVAVENENGVGPFSLPVFVSTGI